jgi:hypothetical protein
VHPRESCGRVRPPSPEHLHPTLLKRRCR